LQLNGNPFLSKDRLIRVKNSIYFNKSKAYLVIVLSSLSMLLGLEVDVGIYFVHHISTTISSTMKAALKEKNG